MAESALYYFSIILICITTVYTLFIFICILGLTSRVKNSKTSVQKISLVIALRDEAENILLLLRSIEKLVIPELEIIFVDDHSSDATLVELQNWNPPPSFSKKIIQLEKETGKKAAVKRGVSEASNEIIAFTDADCVFSPEWLNRISASFDDQQTILAFGPVVLNEPFSPFGNMEALDQLGLTASALGSARMQLPFTCSAANLIVRKSLFVHNGLSDSLTSGDDHFLLETAIKIKVKPVPVWDKESTVFTNPVGFRRFIAQRLRWAGKSGSYKNPIAILVGLLVFLTNLGLLIGLTILPIHPAILAGLLISIGIKAGFDFLLLFLAARGLGVSRKILFYFVPTFLFQILYVPPVALIANFSSPKWKGRSVKSTWKKNNR